MSRRTRHQPAAHLSWPGKPQTIAPVPAQLSTLQHCGQPTNQVANQLILGDNLHALSAVLPKLEGQVDLIYADPPFLTGNRFQRRIGRNEDSRRPDQWLMNAGYDDTWADGDAYLDMLYRRLVLLHRLLKPTGTLYLHLDWHANSYARLLLDEIFGYDRLLNEIIWLYHGPSPVRSAFNRKHDTILVYTKSDSYTFNADAVRTPYDAATKRTFASSKKAGFGKVPNLARGKVPEDWWYFPVVARLHKERTGYPTQKPEALLERVILASSNPGDLVLDPFAGSGTTVAAAARLGRQWLGLDSAPQAIHTIYKRLVRAEVNNFALLAAHAPNQPAPQLGQTGQSLKIKLQVNGLNVQVALPKQQRSGSPTSEFPDWVDYWQVDFNHNGVWRNDWLGTRPGASQQGQLPLQVAHQYAQHGKVTIGVQVVTVFGELLSFVKTVTVEN